MQIVTCYRYGAYTVGLYIIWNGIITSAPNDLVGILFTISIRLRGGDTQNIFAEGKERKSGPDRVVRIVQRDFHTALITRPGTSRGGTECRCTR